MSIREEGRIGEQMARIILKDRFQVDDIFEPDWMVQINASWWIIQVKRKELFQGADHDGSRAVIGDYGAGLARTQVVVREKFRAATGIRTLLLCIDPATDEIYLQALDVLERGPHIDTAHGIRIYPLAAFRRGGRYDGSGGGYLNSRTGTP